MAKNKHFKVSPATRGHAVGVLKAWIARKQAKAQPRLFYSRLTDEFGRGSYAITADDEKLLVKGAEGWEEKLHSTDIDAFTTGTPINIRVAEEEELEEVEEVVEKNDELTCPECGFEAKSAAGLAAHMRKHG